MSAAKITCAEVWGWRELEIRRRVGDVQSSVPANILVSPLLEGLRAMFAESAGTRGARSVSTTSRCQSSAAAMPTMPVPAPNSRIGRTSGLAGGKIILGPRWWSWEARMWDAAQVSRDRFSDFSSGSLMWRFSVEPVVLLGIVNEACRRRRWACAMVYGFGETSGSLCGVDIVDDRGGPDVQILGNWYNLDSLMINLMPGEIFDVFWWYVSRFLDRCRPL